MPIFDLIPFIRTEMYGNSESLHCGTLKLVGQCPGSGLLQKDNAFVNFLEQLAVMFASYFFLFLPALAKMDILLFSGCSFAAG